MKQIDLTPIYKAAAKVMAENGIEEIRLRLLLFCIEADQGASYNMRRPGAQKRV